MFTLDTKSLVWGSVLLSSNTPPPRIEHTLSLVYVFCFLFFVFFHFLRAWVCLDLNLTSYLVPFFFSVALRYTCLEASRQLTFWATGLRLAQRLAMFGVRTFPASFSVHYVSS